MPFVEDLAPFFDPAEFGTAALYDGASSPIYGIFDNAHYAPFQEVDDVAPRFICASSAVPGVVADKALVINSVSYKVKSIQSDGTGVLELFLEKQ